MGDRKGVDGSSMEQRDWARGCLGVVVGAEDGRGWAGAAVSDTHVGSVIREVEMRMVEEESAEGRDGDRVAMERATRTSVYRSCDAKNLGYITYTASQYLFLQVYTGNKPSYV
jgi:hypothetical protein